MSATIENFPTLPIMTFSKFFFLFFNEKQRQFLEETYIFNSSRCQFCLIRPHFDVQTYLPLSTLSDELILNSEAGLLFTCKLKTDTDFLGRAKLEVTAAPASPDIKICRWTTWRFSVRTVKSIVFEKRVYFYD